MPVGAGSLHSTGLFAGEGGVGKVDVEKREQGLGRRLRTPLPKLVEAQPRNAGDEFDARRLAAKMRFNKVHVNDAIGCHESAQWSKKKPVDNLVKASA